MRNYIIYPPERINWCVPASLQTVLKARGIDINQTEIARYFPEYFEGGNFGGFNFDLDLLRNLFKRLGLEYNCSFHNPHEDIFKFDECDIFLRDVEGNVLIAYDAGFHKENRGKPISHLSVILGYNFESGFVELIDNEFQIPLSSIIRHMDPNKQKHYGFYVVS